MVDLLNLIKLEINKIFKPVLISLIITTLVTMGSLINVVYTYSVPHTFEFWNISLDYISLLFPVFVVCPICWVMHDERRNNFIKYTFPRVSKKEYLFSKWLVCILSSFVIIFIPMLLSGAASFLFSNYVVQPKSYEPNFYTNLFMPDFMMNHTFLYIFFHCIWDGILAMIIGTMGFVFSLYLDNILVILTAPFIYSILENFIMCTFGMPKKRFVASFYINTMTDTNTLNLLVGPILAILFIFIFLMYFKISNKKIYDI